MNNKIQPNEKLDIDFILQDLDKYRPRRRGWTWRTPLANGGKLGAFNFSECGESLEKYIAMPAAKYFGNIDPQPLSTITTEIASGRFEDDIRRMRMAAWHGADHIM
ncbi:MAG: LuxR family transcriptional regulator, partial [Fusobacteriaceae bacterium]|nr:LuxR family transcriptional regulator [Fusobacteriaceae bacterium]